MVNHNCRVYTLPCLDLTLGPEGLVVLEAFYSIYCLYNPPLWRGFCIIVTIRRRGREEAYPMRITYDPEADALYIQFRDTHAVDSEDLEEGVTADFGEDGHVIGIEVLWVRERLGVDALTSIVLEQLPLTVAN